MQIGIIGLGKMGSRLALKLLEEGHAITAWNRSPKAGDELKSNTSTQNLQIAQSIKDLIANLNPPRIVWLMLPAGDVTEVHLQEAAKYLEKNDILIDGGNAKFSDTDRRYKEFIGKGIRFLGIGVSGGIIARENGYPLMVGGDKSAYEAVQPILASLAKPSGGYAYFGEGGAGHFVKMVHNAIEYGYMQAIGEGFGVLEKAAYNLDLLAVAKMYQKGTLISGFMMDRTADALRKDPKLAHIEGVIGHASGETIWTLDEAEKDNLPMPVTGASLDFRLQSETDPDIQKSTAARLISALRHEFGGHKVKKK